MSIFYTLDGTKPELLRRPGLGDRSTLRYTEPIRLPSGKAHIRAMAVTRCCDDLYIKKTPEKTELGPNSLSKTKEQMVIIKQCAIVDLRVKTDLIWN